MSILDIYAISYRMATMSMIRTITRTWWKTLNLNAAYVDEWLILRKVSVNL